jgi:flagellar protein FliL
MEKTNQTADNNTSQKKRRKLSIIIGVIGLLLITLTGVIVYSVATETPIREIAEGFRSEPSEETLVLEEFLVNLNSESGPTNQFLKINIALEYRDSNNTETLTDSMPMIRNEILACLRDLRRESVLEEASIEAFKDHAREAINARLDEEIIDEIYITNMIVR